MSNGGRPQRVVLTGSESVGKTTLATQLAAHYRVLCVPEFSRPYAEQKGAPLTLHDVGPIARGQVALEEEYLARAREAGHPLVVHDTDLVSTVTYSQHYYGECPAFVEDLAVARRPAHYLLLDIDVPWVADGVRDRGEQRQAVQTLFEETLTRLGAPVTVIRGSWEHRLESAIAEIDRVMTLSGRANA